MFEISPRAGVGLAVTLCRSWQHGDGRGDGRGGRCRVGQRGRGRCRCDGSRFGGQRCRRRGDGERNAWNRWRIAQGMDGGGGCWAAKRRRALGEQRFKFGTGRGAIDPAHFVSLYEQHVAGHTGDAEPPHQIGLAVDVDVPDHPAGRCDFTDERRHLAAGAAPRCREVEQHHLPRTGRGDRIGGVRGDAGEAAQGDDPGSDRSEMHHRSLH